MILEILMVSAVIASMMLALLAIMIGMVNLAMNMTEGRVWGVARGACLFFGGVVVLSAIMVLGDKFG